MAKRKRKKNKLVIRERKLFREKAWGLCWNDTKEIEIDPRQTPRHYLKILVHELLHAALPGLSEREVVRVSNLIKKGVWQQGYRRIHI